MVKVNKVYKSVCISEAEKIYDEVEGWLSNSPINFGYMRYDAKRIVAEYIANSKGLTVYNGTTDNECQKSPDGMCHTYITVDRDGVSCVELSDGILDHSFSRDGIDSGKCLYCGGEK